MGACCEPKNIVDNFLMMRALPAVKLGHQLQSKGWALWYEFDTNRRRLTYPFTCSDFEHPGLRGVTCFFSICLVESTCRSGVHSVLTRRPTDSQFVKIKIKISLLYLIGFQARRAVESTSLFFPLSSVFSSSTWIALAIVSLSLV